MAEKQTEQKQDIRLLSWNIDGLDEETAEKRTKEICQIINKIDPHIIFLQEVIVSTLNILKTDCLSYRFIPGGDDEYFTAIMLKDDCTEVGNVSITDFPNSTQLRNIIKVQCHVLKIPFTLMTSHLESTGPKSKERKEQLVQGFQEMAAAPPESTVLFGGDLNLRDKELSAVGGIPRRIFDLWEFLGSREACKFTWDLLHNDNKAFRNAPSQPRCRFDRIYMRRSTPHTVEPVNIELIGLERIRSCGKFPSDHWGLLTHYKIISEQKQL